MLDPDIRIKYDGGDAEHHAIDMRLLGSSLQGADKIISDGLIVLIHGRVPKRGERAPVVAKVREPIQGSYELWAAWEAAKSLLPLGLPKAAELAGDFVSEWCKAVIAKFSGKPGEAERAIEAMEALNRDHLAARDASEQRAHEQQMALIGALERTLAMQGRAIEQFAAPVGPSVSSAAFFPTHGAPARLTLEDAEAIRENAKLEWQAIRPDIFRTDGFRFHTNALSVENPERDGFLMAKVHDPRFEEEENVYTEAAQRRSSIEVLARKGYKGGELVAIEIVDFIREVEAWS